MALCAYWVTESKQVTAYEWDPSRLAAGSAFIELMKQRPELRRADSDFQSGSQRLHFAAVDSYQRDWYV